jgi:hypothetical protein
MRTTEHDEKCNAVQQDAYLQVTAPSGGAEYRCGVMHAQEDEEYGERNRVDVRSSIERFQFSSALKLKRRPRPLGFALLSCCSGLHVVS